MRESILENASALVQRIIAMSGDVLSTRSHVKLGREAVYAAESVILRRERPGPAILADGIPAVIAVHFCTRPARHACVRGWQRGRFAARSYPTCT